MNTNRATAPLLVVEGLVAGYADPVVGPVSFDLSQGEVLGIWGPNGSGKSTLLKAVAGAARIFGGHAQRPPGIGISYLDQAPPRLSAMPIQGHELLRLVGSRTAPPHQSLKPWLHRRLDRISGGQFQLLMVWACLAGGSRLVVLDEPTNNLDPTNVALLVELLQSDAARRGVLVVSHERTFIDAACTRVMELR